MKKILLSLLICICLFSCRRDTDVIPTNSNPEISFDVNGTRYVYSGQAKNSNFEVGVFAWKKNPDYLSSATSYSFQGYKDLSNDIHIVFRVDSLRVATYTNTIALGFVLEINNEQYSSIDRRPTAIITSYEKGIVNGTFTGIAISDRNPALNIPPINIVNGVLKNVKLAYWP